GEGTGGGGGGGYGAARGVLMGGVGALPFFKDRNSLGPARFLFGGWQLSGFSIMVSGEPLTITTGGTFPAGDFNGDGTAGDRPNASAASVATSGWDRSQF